MHISDGVLSAPVIAAGWAITIIFLLVTFRLKMKESDMVEEIPKFSVMTAAFFVASLIHLPMGPTSVHPMLNGLVGIVLGPMAYVAMFVGLILQAFLFQHGGVTTIGINAALVGIPAIIVFYLFKRGYDRGISEKLLGLVCGGLAIGLSALLLVIVLISTGQEFLGLAQVAAVAHLPLILIEGILTGTIVAYIAKVKPELLPVQMKK
ncbi:cobalamin (vitamin B12) biosynthesis CbiM protein [Methanosalsum zhilinae DSM 4017]|uniref:Cobalamin (Vitamin B12) biosynthesis CbiM protein n=1 Tax=Methanosalsum zhilinae (strain DSM 4017 / NBRC 107636 / OCM 62 / WeN5) TaxID=679901 RepID=F7XKQ8_METZD|nr:cobalt transporter CbiM [Methanosalsum zhilinae]AEH61771.1 cobalamin (vitamin B12) biosynthesis CbiM protein [Methanosalsum zhilinae DSM 4017]